MNLGENICRLRTGRGMSQGDLAEALDVSRQSISKWETGGAVPELEKLMRLAALFGVTLDELVSGSAPETPRAQETPRTPEAPPAQAAPEQAGVTARQVVGIVLLSLGLTLSLAFILLSGGWLAVLCLASPLWIGGIICLTARKHPGLWYLWAQFFLADTYLRYATGLSWATVRWTPLWTPEMNYTRLIVAWCQLLGGLALLGGTVWRLGREPLARTQRTARLFWAGWALFALLCLPFGTWLFQLGGDATLWLVQLVRSLQDLGRLALLAALFTCLRRWAGAPGSRSGTEAPRI